MKKVALFGEEEFIYGFRVPQAGWEQVFDGPNKMGNDDKRRDRRGPDGPSSEPQCTVHLKISGRQFRGAVWKPGSLNRASLEATTSVGPPKKPQSERHPWNSRRCERDGKR